MSDTPQPRRVRPPRAYVAATLLVGTALSTLGMLPSEASAEAVRNISRYCTVCWKNARLQPDYWSDCTQEVLARLVETVPVRSWDRILAQDTEERREFVRAIDAVKKRTLRAQRPGPLVSEVPDKTDLNRRDREEQRRLVEQAADQFLSPRQSRILALSLDGWSVQDISKKMALPTARVSDEKYKAIQKLRRELV